MNDTPTGNVQKIREPAFLERATRVSDLAKRLNVAPNPNFVIGYQGSHGEWYCTIDLMNGFLDKIESTQTPAK